MAKGRTTTGSKRQPSRRAGSAGTGSGKKAVRKQATSKAQKAAKKKTARKAAKRKVVSKKRTSSAAEKAVKSEMANETSPKSPKSRRGVVKKRVEQARSAADSAAQTQSPQPDAAGLVDAVAKPERGKRKAAGPRRVAAADPVSDRGAPKSDPPQERPVPKTRLSPERLEEFKTLLLSKRAEFAGAMQHLRGDAYNRDGGRENETSAMPIHMADRGSDNWEQEFTLDLLANESARIREIDEALERIENGTYGICLATYKPIKLDRLRAKPWAKYCIEYARLRDEGRAP